MRKTRGVMILMGLMVGLVVPSTALGVILVPPGKSGVNQYYEDIPSSQGNAAPPTFGSAATSPRSNLGSLGRGRAGAAKLSRLGKDGQAAVALAQATAPTPHPGGTGVTASGSAGGGSSAVPTGRAGSGGSASPGSTAGAIARDLGGAGAQGLGAVFPALLIVMLLAAVALGVWRLRHPAGSAGH